MKDLVKAVTDLVNGLKGIPKSITTDVTTNYKTTGTPPALPSGGDWRNWIDPNAAADMMPAMPMAAGGDFYVTKPTMFLAGEAGPERAFFSGANKTSSPAGGGPSMAETNAKLDDIAALLAMNKDLPFKLALAVKSAIQASTLSQR